MAKGQDSPKLRLKNGSEVDAREAYFIWRRLIGAQSQRPHYFQALLDLAQGQQTLVKDEMRSALQERYATWFNSDGALLPVVSAVFENAYRKTPDGPTLVNPFQLASQAEVDLFARVERADFEFLRRLFGKGDPPGHAP